MNKISVIVPAYNAEKYIGQCLDSLFAQTLKDIQVIVVDDGSKDRTLDVVSSYNINHNSMIVIHQENKGLCKARIVGLDVADGEYIGWVDADDFIEPQMFEKLYQVAEREDSEIAMCDYDFYPNEVNVKKKWYKPYLGVCDWNFIERNTQLWNKIVKKSLLERINFRYWLERGSDGMYAALLIQASKIVSLEEALYHYRVGHVSMSSNRNDYEKYRENILLTREQRAAVENFTQWHEYFDYRVIYSILQATIVAAHNGKRWMYEECLKQLREMKYMENPLTKKILDYNHGKFKSFVLRNVIPANYRLAALIGKLKF